MFGAVLGTGPQWVPGRLEEVHPVVAPFPRPPFERPLPEAWTVDMVHSAQRSFPGPVPAVLTVLLLVLGLLVTGGTAASAAPSSADGGPVAYAAEVTPEQLALVMASGIDRREVLTTPGGAPGSVRVEVVLGERAANALIAQGVPLEVRSAAAVGGGDEAGRRLPSLERAARPARGVRRIRAHPSGPGQAGSDRPVRPGPGHPRVQGDEERAADTGRPSPRGPLQLGAARTRMDHAGDDPAADAPLRRGLRR